MGGALTQRDLCPPKERKSHQKAFSLHTHSCAIGETFLPAACWWGDAPASLGPRALPKKTSHLGGTVCRSLLPAAGDP